MVRKIEHVEGERDLLVCDTNEHKLWLQMLTVSMMKH
jgi:hypothetical protein